MAAEAARDPRRRRTWPIIALVAAAVVLLAAVSAGAVVLVRHAGTSTTGSSRQPQAPPPSPTAVTPTATSTPSTTSPPSPSATGQSFPDLYRSVSNGVIRIETTACDGGGVGSGFLVAPNMVATVAHVVGGAVSVVVRNGGSTTTGTVVGYDPAAELALIRTAHPLVGHVFDLGSRPPDVGIDVGAIGYPLGGPESLSKGAVSGLGRRIDVEGHRLRDMVQTDASINPGNSGGPLLTTDGTVVGIIEAKRTDAENMGYAIPANRAATQLRSWMTTPAPVSWVDDCSAPTGPDGVRVDVTDRSGHVDGPPIAQAFSRYIDGINTGDYASAYAVLSPAERQKVDYAKFADGTTSTYILALSVDAVTATGSGDRVEVQFTSVQEPAYGVHGQSCSDWDMTYTMVHRGRGWLIDSATPHPGSPTAC